MRVPVLAALLWISAGIALAQGTSVGFGSADHNTDAPVEVTSAQLDIDEAAGTALFTGDVVVIQDTMRLTAPRVLVIYKEDQRGVDRMEATGGVLIVSGEDAAEGDRADYFVDGADLALSGNVLTTQGPNIISSDKMDINMRDGTALISGNVKTILQPGGNN